jgi:hypothetical protein
MSLLDYTTFLKEGFLFEGGAESGKPQWKEDMDKKVLAFNPQSSPTQSVKTGEAVRANFGSEDGGQATDQIIKFFKDMYGFLEVEIAETFSGKKDISYTFYDGGKNELKNAKAGTNKYITHKVKADGNIFYVVNTGATGKTVGKKKTNPAALGITDKQYLTAESLANDVILRLKESGDTFYEPAKNYMISCVEAVLSNAEIKWANVTALLDDSSNWSTSYFSLGQEHGGLENEDKKDIINDFGEILDGIYLLKAVADVKTSTDTSLNGVIFPGKSNEPLADISLDGAKISSKAEKGGGRPSIQPLVEIISSAKPAALSGKGVGLTEDEVELMNMFNHVNAELRSGQWLDSVEVYLYFARIMTPKVAPLAITRLNYLEKVIGKDLSKSAIVNYFDKTLVTPQEKQKFIEAYWTKTGFKAKKPPNYADKGNDLIATVYYPLASEVVEALNTHYGIALTNLVRKFVLYKQVYLGIDVKQDPDALKISGISSKYVPEVKFYARASSNAWNAGMGFEWKT